MSQQLQHYIARSELLHDMKIDCASWLFKVKRAITVRGVLLTEQPSAIARHPWFSGGACHHHHHHLDGRHRQRKIRRCRSGPLHLTNARMGQSVTRNELNKLHEQRSMSGIMQCFGQYSRGVPSPSSPSSPNLSYFDLFSESLSTC
eukprot:5081459-Amphidinium_carterae.1